jgi:hypothetical protein
VFALAFQSFILSRAFQWPTAVFEIPAGFDLKDYLVIVYNHRKGMALSLT